MQLFGLRVASDHAHNLKQTALADLQKRLLENPDLFQRFMTVVEYQCALTLVSHLYKQTLGSVVVPIMPVLVKADQVVASTLSKLNTYDTVGVVEVVDINWFLENTPTYFRPKLLPHQYYTKGRCAEIQVGPNLNLEQLKTSMQAELDKLFQQAVTEDGTLHVYHLGELLGELAESKGARIQTKVVQQAQRDLKSAAYASGRNTEILRIDVHYFAGISSQGLHYFESAQELSVFLYSKEILEYPWSFL